MAPGSSARTSSTTCSSKNPEAKVVVFDRLTYAGNLDNLADIANDPRYRFIHGDICDRERGARQLCAETTPSVVFNLAAESHVDRSIDGPGEFVRTNVTGTFEMLEARARSSVATTRTRASVSLRSRLDRRGLRIARRRRASSPRRRQYAPNSPYAASKAGADHLRARVLSHLRPADDHHQLLEQLRPATSFPKSSSR